MNVTIKQLQVFVSIAETGSFAKACNQLHLSQPAISASLKNLEAEVGGTLLARTTRKTELTPEGMAFFPVALRILMDIDTSLEDVKSLFELRRGKVDIAVMSTFASSKFPTILAIFHQQHPEIKVTVHDIIAEDVVNMVRREKVELGITFDPGEDQELTFIPLLQDRFMVALPPEHPLNNSKSITWKDLTKVNYISLQKPSSIRQQIELILDEKGIFLSPIFEAHQLITIGKMVAEGLGVSIIPEVSVKQIQSLGVTLRPIISPKIERSIGIILKKHRAISTPAQKLQNISQQHFKQ